MPAESISADSVPDFRSTNRPVSRVAVLGATGSIGVAALDVIENLNRCDPDFAWEVSSMSGHSQIDPLIELAGGCHTPPKCVVVSDAEMEAQAAKALKTASTQTNSRLTERCRLDVGPDALVRAATEKDVDVVVAAIVGRAGLESTLAAVHAGKRVALANKETLVVAGPVVTRAAADNGAELLPVDSEHSAIFQCLAESRARQSQFATAKQPNTAADPSAKTHWPGVRRLILTASGGPFRDWTTAQMREATIEQALAHPTWKMGAKITIDSASMMNKALEVIEAKWLFDVPADKIEVVVHPQSLIHSLVEFEDGSLIAQVSPPDMRMPIQYALTFPRRLPCPAPELDRTQGWDMSLCPADPDRFPALALGFEVARVGGTAGAVVNAANETAVDLFLNGQIRFTDIPEICRRTLLDHDHESSPTLERLLKLDVWARGRARELAQI
ncbi:1-deoxy-D-xylulose-5-phosphate reductoisomerase [Rhodopirellula europaea]|uniref:1-deoxy-D-xylulose 5-phosphate reductoisomerase n=1 Tax=Rhodopirellula europaea 6C TaxID=1263867 RepID=M2AN69_9BACT|nr:1-deoxy-D-xylulose-5-phosphate reductoisomerase [Rhodopirellula europaea]EMB18560.1 1-deoxy-D-xylulose 5-phosphate reductoisomerase [Rhodopirellula europaea 6C]